MLYQHTWGLTYLEIVIISALYIPRNHSSNPNCDSGYDSARSNGRGGGGGGRVSGGREAMAEWGGVMFFGRPGANDKYSERK